MVKARSLQHFAHNYHQEFGIVLRRGYSKNLKLKLINCKGPELKIADPLLGLNKMI